MKVTRLGNTRPLLTIGTILSSSGPSGQVPTSNGSNGVAWGSNVAIISAGGSNVVGPYVNFAAGSNITLTIDQVGAVASNTIRIHASGASSFGSNSNAVSQANAPGASTDSSRADHVHMGVTSLAHTSNTFAGPVVLTASGSLGITSPTPGTYNLSSTGSGGGSSLTVADEGMPLATAATTLDFVGAGVAASGAGATKTITISGGSGGISGKVPVAVGSATQTSSASTLAVTIAAASSGNLLIAQIMGLGTADVTGITSTNTTWTVLHSSTAGTSPKAEIWKGVVSGGSSGTTVTITFAANNSDRAAVVSEWNGITGTLDQSASRAGLGVGSGGSHSSPAILPTNANALVLANASTTNGTVRYQWASQMVAFEPFHLETANLRAYIGAYYAFPGTTPIALQVMGPNTGNFSSAIVSVT